MKVKFKDGSIVDAIQYKSTGDLISSEFMEFVNKLIKANYKTAGNIGGFYTVMHDNSIKIEWETYTEKHSITAPDGGYVYHNQNSQGIFAISNSLFYDHALEMIVDHPESQSTSIQDDIKALENKIAKHLQEIGAVSGEFVVAQQNVKFLAMYEVNVNDYWKFSGDSGTGKEFTVDALIDQYNKAPWKFGKKGGRRG